MTFRNPISHESTKSRNFFWFRVFVFSWLCAFGSVFVHTQSTAADVFKALQYRHIGPPGNRVNAIAGVAGDPNVVYAGAASGGIFKSTDGGLHWQPIFDDQIVMSIGALAVARSDANVVWAGTGDPNIRPNIEIGNGVYKSTDAGATWSHMGLDETGRIGRIAIDPRNPSIVFVAAMGHCYGPQQQRGVFRTRDAGKTWERVLFVDENTGAVDVTIDPTNPRVVFAATWQLAVHPWFSESGGPGGGIYVSRDGGTTWTNLTGRHGLAAAPIGRTSVIVAPSNSKRIYALVETTADQGNLWKSDDGGESWTVASRDPAINRRARYFSRIGVLPDNPNEVYFLAQSLYVSLDAGATTKIIRENFPDHHDIWFDPLNQNRILLANDRYVNISTTRGRAWFHVSLPNAQINRVAVDRRVPYNVYGSRQDGPSYRGPSNSLVMGSGVPSAVNGSGIIPPDFWEWTIGAESGWVIPDRDDDNIVWVSSANNVQHIDMRTGMMIGASPWPSGRGGGAGGEPGAGEGGGRGGPVADRPFRRNWTIPLAMSPHDPHRIYAGSQFVHESADGGRTWSVISPDLTTNDKSKQGIPPGLWPETQDVPSTLIAIEESAIEQGVIWTGSNDGVVSVTRDGGKTWTNVTSNIPNLGAWGFVNSIAPSRHAFGAAYVTVDRHRAADNATYVFKTEDYGRTWKSIGGGVPKSVFAYARVVREDPRRKGMLYLGTENGLYVTLDDGATWTPMQGNLPHTPIAWMVVQEDFDDLVVATWGRGIWVLDDIAALQQLTPEVLTARAHLFDPRPAYLFVLRRPTTTESFATEFDPPSHAGRNPPYGAPITYSLGGPANDVKVTILDAKGAAVGTLQGTRTAGLNRVWWDLRSSAPARTTSQDGRGEGVADSSQEAGSGRGATSPLVAPGAYTVRLSVDGQEQTSKLVVRRDPAAPPN
jgi:photosystem II stability/assembly factor-like uncharacterized protein